MDYRILDIVEGTSVDGPGLRTSIYFAGCRHCCKGCHNPQSWDFDAGKLVSSEEIIEIVRYNDFNVTLSGGDPLYHPKKIADLCRRIKEELGKEIWCYTGFTWEYIIADTSFSELLQWVDVVVDGPFIESLRDTSLRFRGSSNQRIVDVRKSIAEGKAVMKKYN